MPEPIVESLRLHATRQPSRTALACGDRRITFAGLEERTRAFAVGLAARGVERGERLLICLPAGIDAVVAEPVPGMPAGWRASRSVPPERAEVPGDHFSMLDRYAAGTAAVVGRWVAGPGL